MSKKIKPITPEELFNPKDLVLGEYIEMLNQELTDEILMKDIKEGETIEFDCLQSLWGIDDEMAQEIKKEYEKVGWIVEIEAKPDNYPKCTFKSKPKTDEKV